MADSKPVPMDVTSEDSGFGGGEPATSPASRDTSPVPRPGERAETPPQAPFRALETLWIQVTGTLCNLRCTHCFISCSPENDTLEFMSRDQVQRYLGQAAGLGVKEFYFTGGEPFLHREIVDILGDALELGPTTVLTNGVLITERMASALAGLAERSPYSLEVRVSLDAPEEEANDAIRGDGVFRRAVRGIRRLEQAGLLPIVTATELVVEDATGSGGGFDPGGGARRRPGDASGPTPEAVDGASVDTGEETVPVGVEPRRIPARPSSDGFYRRFHEMLSEAGVERPRVKILPVFNMGMLDDRDDPGLVTPEMLEGFDVDTLQCTSSRLVAHDGVYACPILAGEPGARMDEDDLSGATEPCSLYHPSCTTCYLTGMTCRNF